MSQNSIKFQNVWYSPRPCGKNRIADMMKVISERSECSKIYTNHCLRHTTANAMKKGGYNIQGIAYVTDHSNYQSLESYLSAPDEEDYEHYNDILFKYHTSKEVRNRNIDPDPLANDKSRLKLERKSTPTATVSNPNQMLTEVHQEENQVNVDEVDENMENEPPLTQIVKYNNDENEFEVPTLDLDVRGFVAPLGNL